MEYKEIFYNKRFLFLVSSLVLIIVLLFILFTLLISKTEDKKPLTNNTLITKTEKNDPGVVYSYLYGKIVSVNDSSVVISADIQGKKENIEIKINQENKNNIVDYQDNKKNIFDYNEIKEDFYLSVKLKDFVNSKEINEKEINFDEIIVYTEEPVAE